MNSVLYKYRANSQFTDEIFKTRQVWLSTASQLNDPFECSIQQLASDWIATRTETMKRAQVQGFVMEAIRARREGAIFLGQPTSTIETTLERLKSIGGTFDEAYSQFRALWQEITGAPPSDPDDVFRGLDIQLQSVGIFSMSAISDHPLMWAHYGAEHAGIAIGFERSRGAKLSDPDHCLEVYYQDDLPRYREGFRPQLLLGLDSEGRPRTIMQMSFDDPVFKAAIRTKATTWAYEKEWRYVEESGGRRVWPGPIVEIVFGLRCAEGMRAHYRELVSVSVPNEVRFFEIVKVPNSNALERRAVR